MGQAVNTFWDERLERVGAAVKANPVTRRRVRARRLIDAIVLTIILAATATCFSVYSRARAELDAALIKHGAMGERVADLTIKVQKMERDVKQLRTDSKAIELFARQKFGFVRAGDVVIKIAQDGDASTVNGGVNGGVGGFGGVGGANGGVNGGDIRTARALSSSSSANSSSANSRGASSSGIRSSVTSSSSVSSSSALE